MTDQTGNEDSDREAKRVKELEERGIPPEMEEAESKGAPHDDRLQSEVSHGRPDEKERNPTGEG